MSFDKNELRSETAHLGTFLADCLTVGCLKGFRHFEVYLRGREELLLRVYNGNHRTSGTGYRSHQPNSAPMAIEHKGAVPPRVQRTMTNSPDTPPISPIDKELKRDEGKTAFLIAGYARYKCPYVWLRSHHSKLVQLPDTEEIDADIPLKLDTTAEWKTQDIRLWDIIAEIISLTHPPPPANPFEVDMYYFDTLPLEECVTSTGAMVDFLQRVWVHAKETCTYADRVLEDIKQLQIRHFNAFEDVHDMVAAHRENMAKAGGSPVVDGTGV